MKKYIYPYMAFLLLLAGCSGDFLDKEPTDSVSSDEVGVPGKILFISLLHFND